MSWKIVNLFPKPAKDNRSRRDTIPPRFPSLCICSLSASSSQVDVKDVECKQYSIVIFCFTEVSAKGGCHLPNEITNTSTLKAFSYIECVLLNACSNCSDCQIQCSASSHHRFYGRSCCITDITHCFQSDMGMQ